MSFQSEEKLKRKRIAIALKRKEEKEKLENKIKTDCTRHTNKKLATER